MRVLILKEHSVTDLQRSINNILQKKIHETVKDIKYSCFSFESGFVDYTAMIIFETKKNDNK